MANQNPDQSQDTGENLPAMPKALPHAQHLTYLQGITGNVDSIYRFFNAAGELTADANAVLKTLPLNDPQTGKHLVDTLQEQGNLSHPAIEDALQKTFFKPNEAKFSFEINSEGGAPSPGQLSQFRKLNLVNEITVPIDQSYDCGVVFGGLLSAIQARTEFLLEQKVTLGSIALLGSQRRIIEGREDGAHLKAVIGEEHYEELERQDRLPDTEFELMTTFWESLCRKDSSLRDIPVIEVNSAMRVGHIKEAPGTPDTVVDLLNTLTSGYRVPGLGSAPSKFVLASSQPHALRQREDFLATMAALNYPGNELVDVVGYGTGEQTKLKLFASEITKFVHAQFLARYS